MSWVRSSDGRYKKYCIILLGKHSGKPVIGRLKVVINNCLKGIDFQDGRQVGNVTNRCGGPLGLPYILNLEMRCIYVFGGTFSCVDSLLGCYTV